jgi:ATP-dependent Clp protease ATP-binding subunit ClpC
MHYKFTQKYSLSLYKSKPFMDNNFSAQVKEIISFSREEALRLGNDFIGTEHLLLGLIRDGEKKTSTEIDLFGFISNE